MKTIKYSRQRNAIIRFLNTRKDHPTADVIYENIRKEYPRISLGTVYRNLALMAELGTILRFSTGDGKEHFDGNAAPHNHFVCKSCGCVQDLVFSPADYRKIAADSCFYGRIEGHTTMFTGLCERCLEEEREFL